LHGLTLDVGQKLYYILDGLDEVPRDFLRNDLHRALSTIVDTAKRLQGGM
jgi:hypothetical protein